MSSNAIERQFIKLTYTDRRQAVPQTTIHRVLGVGKLCTRSIYDAEQFKVRAHTQLS